MTGQPRVYDYRELRRREGGLQKGRMKFAEVKSSRQEGKPKDGRD